MAEKECRQQHRIGHSIDAMNPSRGNLKAFTLIEVLITLAVFTIMIEAIYTTVIMSQRSLNVYAQLTAPKENLRSALGAIVKDLRGARNPFILKEEHSFSMSFQHPLYGPVKYSWTDTGSDAGKIFRTSGPKTNMVAYNITSFSITEPLTNNKLLVRIGEAQGQNSFQLEQEVALRLQTGIF